MLILFGSANVTSQEYSALRNKIMVARVNITSEVGLKVMALAGIA